MFVGWQCQKRQVVMMLLLEWRERVLYASLLERERGEESHVTKKQQNLNWSKFECITESLKKSSRKKYKCRDKCVKPDNCTYTDNSTYCPYFFIPIYIKQSTMSMRVHLNDQSTNNYTSYPLYQQRSAAIATFFINKDPEFLVHFVQFFHSILLISFFSQRVQYTVDIWKIYTRWWMPIVNDSLQNDEYWYTKNVWSQSKFYNFWMQFFSCNNLWQCTMLIHETYT